MPRGRPKKTIEVSVEIPNEDIHQDIKVKSEKEKLLELYEQLKALKIHSISDLENKIANCR